MTLLECKRCGARELVEKKHAFHKTQRECIESLGARMTELERLAVFRERPELPEPAVTREIPIVKEVKS